MSSASQAHELPAAAEHAGGEVSLEEIWAGLASEPKRLPCKLFYDTRGSHLFEQICGLPEYYLTRAELDILEQHGQEIAARIGPEAVLVELGSGTSVKTRVLLDALARPAAYIPIDISGDVLQEAARGLARRYPNLDIRPVSGDYLAPLRLPIAEAESKRIAVFFPGSTIGNFEPSEAAAFLARMRRELGPYQRLLVGVDMPKDPSVLVRAYADAAGVTASFNLNILRVLNRRFRANFVLSRFGHRAIYESERSRIAMHLVSRQSQSVRIGSRVFRFEAGEAIVTEYCHKYAPEAFASLAESAGFHGAGSWLDREGLFSVHLMRAC